MDALKILSLTVNEEQFNYIRTDGCCKDDLECHRNGCGSCKSLCKGQGEMMRDSERINVRVAQCFIMGPYVM